MKLYSRAVLAAEMAAGLTFASFASSDFNASALEDPSLFLYDQLDSEVQVMFKKCSKRDEATRLKAIEELFEFVGKLQDASQLDPIITAWVGHLRHIFGEPTSSLTTRQTHQNQLLNRV